MSPPYPNWKRKMQTRKLAPPLALSTTRPFLLSSSSDLRFVSKYLVTFPFNTKQTEVKYIGGALHQRDPAVFNGSDVCFAIPILPNEILRSLTPLYGGRNIPSGEGLSEDIDRSSVLPHGEQSPRPNSRLFCRTSRDRVTLFIPSCSLEIWRSSRTEVERVCRCSGELSVEDPCSKLTLSLN